MGSYHVDWQGHRLIKLIKQTKKVKSRIFFSWPTVITIVIKISYIMCLRVAQLILYLLRVIHTSGKKFKF